MKTTRKRFGLALALAVLAPFALAGSGARPAAAATTQQLVLGGGCFWGVEAVFRALNGVTATMPGYSGGAASTAHYEDVSTGTTGHAESVRITYDPAKISLQQLLDVYFLIAHDPTELNRQGPDEGSQYRSVIFVANAEQRDAAQAEIARLTAEHKFSAPIVTKLEPFKAFFPAEEYHRDYLATHMDSPYIIENDLPKLAALKKTYPQLVAQK